MVGGIKDPRGIAVRVPQATVDWLLQPANPAVRTFTLQHVFGRPAHDAEVAAARSDVMRAPWIKRLMEAQQLDGWWYNPKNCYTPRGVGTVWHLQVLAELGADGSDERIARACERFVDQNGMPDGGFACGRHPKRYSEECLTGHMLYTLALLGRGNDERARKALAWVLARQLDDGGWNCRPNQSHSSFISTLGAMKALAVFAKEKNDREARTALARAVDFLLIHRVFFSHTSGKPVKAFWPPQIHVPAHYAYDLLHPLRTLALANAAADPRLDEALDLLEARADPKARWQIDVASPVITIEPVGKASKWATANALHVLRHFGRVELG